MNAGAAVASSLDRKKMKQVQAARKMIGPAARAARPAPPSLSQMGQGVRTSIQLRDLPDQMKPQLEQMAGLRPSLGPQAPGVVLPGAPPPPAVHVHVHTHVKR